MGPPLPPATIGAVFGNPQSPIRVELFLDLVCPFSRKMWKAVMEGDVVKSNGDKVCFVVNQVVQPWHPAGTAVHEAAFAVKECCFDKYIDFVSAVYAKFDAGRFKDDTTWNMSRQQIYDELLELAEATGIPTAPISEKLAIKAEGGNCGNSMTQYVKWAVKYHRCRGVHVTPTVHVNGLEAGVVSSGWTSEQWCEYLKAEGADNFKGETV